MGAGHDQLLGQIEIISGLPFVRRHDVALVAVDRVVRQAGEEGGQDQIQRLRVLLASAKQGQVVAELVAVPGIEDLREDLLPVGLDRRQDRAPIEPVDQMQKVEDAGTRSDPWGHRATRPRAEVRHARSWSFEKEEPHTEWVGALPQE
jgi:hypothetical protein